MEKKTFRVGWETLFLVLIFLVVHYFIVKNVYLLSRDMLYADFSVERVRPVPQYGIGRIPDTPLAREVNAYDHLALDFAQVYFPSRKFDDLESNYVSGEYDPDRRPSRYAPFVHFLCAITYCRLDYGPASLFHLFLQLLLFYSFFTASFILLGIPKSMPAALLFVNSCLFLTPAGLSWFERGQFSLYVATSYLLLLLGIFKRRSEFFLLAAIFGFIKWISFPTIFILASVFLLASRDLKQLKTNIRFTALFAAIILILLAFFPTLDYYFWQGLYRQEMYGAPRGVSLVGLLPIRYVKLLPLFLICLGFLHVRKYRDHLKEYLPFFTGVGVVLLMYPTKAYEYNVPTLFCFVPFMIDWAGFPWSRAPIRTLMGYVFFLFLMSASYSRVLVRLFETEYVVHFMYLLVAAVFLLGPLILPTPILGNGDQTNSGSGTYLVTTLSHRIFGEPLRRKTVFLSPRSAKT